MDETVEARLDEGRLGCAEVGGVGMKSGDCGDCGYWIVSADGWRGGTGDL